MCDIPPLQESKLKKKQLSVISTKTSIDSIGTLRRRTPDHSVGIYVFWGEHFSAEDECP